jgi:beta-1,4-N-acetylglucosaminyltransferase
MIKLIIVLGEGGHTTEMLHLVKLLGEHYDYSYAVSKEDMLSATRIIFPGQVFKLNRPRGKSTRVLSAIFRTILCFLKSLQICLHVRPHAVISTGPAIAVPISLVSKLFGARIIFIETGSRVKTLSFTGRIMYSCADLFFVQWPQLVARWPRGIYAGRLM